MSVSKQPRVRSTRKKDAVGLMAFGSSGPWEIAIDQTLSAPDRWFAQVEGPSVELYFEIPSRKIVERAIEFLGARGKVASNAVDTPGCCELTLGTSKSTRVKLVQDDEFSDRFFLVIEPNSGPCIRFTLAGEELTHVIEALRQAKDDLE